MGLSRTISEINSGYSGKSQFFQPHVFNAPIAEVALGIL